MNVNRVQLARVHVDLLFPRCHDAHDSRSVPMSPLFVIFLTVFIDMVGFGIIIPVLPLYAEHFHATPIAIGWLTGIYSGMQIIFTPILGRLSDRFGRRPVLMLVWPAPRSDFSSWAGRHSLPLLFVARIIDGVTGGNISTRRPTSPTSARRKTRSRSMGMIGAAFGLGFTFGPMIGGIMSRISYSAPFYFAAALAAVNVVLLYFILPESLSAGTSRATARRRTRLAEVFQHGHGRMFGTIVATYFFIIAGFAIMTTLFALFTEKRFGYDAHANGYLLVSSESSRVILQGGLIGRLVKMFGETSAGSHRSVLAAPRTRVPALVPNLRCCSSSALALSLASGFVSPTSERSRLANDRSQLAGPRARPDAIGRQHRSSARSVARRLAAHVRSAQTAVALWRNAVLRRSVPLPDRSCARLLSEKTGR